MGHSDAVRLRWMLVLTWVVFASLATAAGFAAVDLVGQGLSVAAAPGAGRSVTTTTATATATTGPTAKPRKSTEKTSTPTPSHLKSSTASPAGRTAGRSLRGNYVSATCRGDQVTLAASPAPGWSLDEYRPGPDREAKAKFTSESGEVEVKVSCAGGRPVFETGGHYGRSGDG